MFKKMIALLVIFAMLVPLSSAVAADEPTAQPTIEEILNGYHEKAFAAQTAEENGGASTYSRSGSGSSQTLEQETVAELTAAGYEAYNVTGDNYETLEETLHTDFAEMGLDPNSSYVVVISGEEQENQSNPNSRVIYPPVQENLDGDNGGGGESDGHTYFDYTYNGTKYVMRYVTVTAAENTALGQTSYIDLLSQYGPDDLSDDLNIPISIVSSVPGFSLVGTVYGIFSAILPDTPLTQSESLLYQGGTNWTITYTQIYDTEAKCWTIASSVEYVTMRYFLYHTYYDSTTNQYESESTNGTYPILYSEFYCNEELMKERAAFAHENHSRWSDEIEYVTYEFDDEPVITHTRWSEYLGYEPA